MTKKSSEAETQPVAVPLADSQKLEKARLSPKLYTLCPLGMLKSLQDAQAEVTKRRHAERKSLKLQSELQSVRPRGASYLFNGYSIRISIICM